MTASGIRDLSFVDDFQDFYTEVIRLRSVAESGIMEVRPGGDAGYQAQADVIRTRLISLLERGSLFAGRAAGELGFGLHREVQYVMAALADETFLRVDWGGREYWSSHLLETRLFNSHNAGEEFFTRLDRLLDQPERSYTDIYAVYLLALALGFRGKYQGVEDGGRLQEYRRCLFLRVYRRRPELFSDSGRLFPESYRHTLSENVAKKLPSPHRWFLGLAAAILIWASVADVIWGSLTHDLMTSVTRINSAPVSTTPTPVPSGAR